MVFTTQWLTLQEDIARLRRDAERARQAGEPGATLLEREYARLQTEADQIPESDRHIQDGPEYNPKPWLSDQPSGDGKD